MPRYIPVVSIAWDGTAESFREIPGKIRDTELILQSPELGWISTVINHCYVYYTHYGLERIDNLTLTMFGHHYLRIINNKTTNKGRSLIISYDAIRNNIEAIQSQQKLSDINTWVKGGVLLLLITITFHKFPFEIKKMEWPF